MSNQTSKKPNSGIKFIKEPSQPVQLEAVRLFAMLKELACKILQENNELSSFQMNQGSVSFAYHTGQTININDWSEDYQELKSIINNEFFNFTDVNFQIVKNNDKFLILDPRFQ